MDFQLIISCAALFVSGVALGVQLGEWVRG